MSKKKIYITGKDAEKLRELVQSGAVGGENGKFYLDQLVSEIAQAEIVDPLKIPKDVITMNSQVRFRDLDTKESYTYSIVYPSFADSAKNRISILAPIGMALLGYRVGDIVEWKVPAGTRRLKIEEVLYQPEAAGEYDL
ncbi:MAG: nucleoside diphosphate kinase regulator [Candidatus Omnitrophota bacterium]|jgi:regulator of nucleoside diphosphate kinase